MKRAAFVVGLAYFWTVVASAIFCTFNFRLFTFPYVQWWEGLYYIRNMLWLPRIRDFGQWPLFWFVDGFVLASALIAALVRTLIATLLPNRKDRQPNLYGTSEFADERAMRSGGIITEKRS